MEVIRYRRAKSRKNFNAPVFEGEIIQTMSQLVSQKLKPLSVAQIMEQRILERESYDGFSYRRWNNFGFSTGDGVMYLRNSKIKIVYDSKTLKNIDSNSRVSRKGALILPYEIFDETDGVEFTLKEAERYGNKYLHSLEEVLSNPIWLALARDDKELLKEYTKLISSSFDPNESIYFMRILIRHFGTGHPLIEDPWYFSGVHIDDRNVGTGISGNSWLSGNNWLNKENWLPGDLTLIKHRFVGIKKGIVTKEVIFE